jgi:hypothetical protein
MFVWSSVVWMMTLVLEHLKSLQLVKFSKGHGHVVVHGQVCSQPVKVLEEHVEALQPLLHFDRGRVGDGRHLVNF